MSYFANATMSSIRLFASLILAASFLWGCAGAKTFQEVARAGDTVALASGWKQNFSSDNITVTVTPPVGAATVYGPNDPAIRAVIDLYPDPLSSILVSKQIGHDLTPFAQTYANVTNSLTNGDPDWWQTTVFIDLPDTLPVGTTTIDITNPQGESVQSTVDIVSGAGTAGTFESSGGPLTPDQLAAMKRVAHNTISFSGATVPYAIQLDLNHSPDAAHGGTGYSHVVNPRGDLKSVQWTDTGTNMRIILLPTRSQPLSTMKGFKLYVAGGITNLSLVSVKAYDSSGSPVSGITASIN